MDLTLEQLRSITLGAVWIRQQEKGIVFSRFTDEQLALYDNTTIPYQENFHNTIRYNAGIRLSFRTNSRSLYIAGYFYKEREVRRHFSVDVMVDGKYLDSLDNFTLEPLHGRYIDEQYEMGDYEKTFDLGQGEKTVCVHFPWSIMPVFRHIALDDGASLTPLIPAKKLLVYGDSITHGNTVRYSCNHYIPRLARAMDVQVRNKAIAGTTTFPEIVRLESPYDPDYVLVAYGSNDWDRHEEAFFAEKYREMMQAIAEKYPQAQVFVISPIWRADQDTHARRMGPLCAIEANILAISEGFPNVTVIPGMDLVPHDLQYYADAGLHPNDAGYEFYFQNLWPKIEATRRD